MSDLLWVDSPPSLQTPNERIIYTLTTTNWGSSPSSVAITAYDETLGGTDVTTTVFPTNSPSVASDTITLSPLRDLTAYHNFRIEYQFDTGGSTLEARKLVKCVPYYVIGSPIKISASEVYPLAIDMTNRVASPTSATIFAYDEGQGDLDVTATVINDNTPSPSGNKIPIIVKSLTNGHSYRISARVVKTTQIWEPSIRITCAF